MDGTDGRRNDIQYFSSLFLFLFVDHFDHLPYTLAVRWQNNAIRENKTCFHQFRFDSAKFDIYSAALYAHRECWRSKPIIPVFPEVTLLMIVRYFNGFQFVQMSRPGSGIDKNVAFFEKDSE